MPKTRDDCTRYKNVTSTSGLSGQSITAIYALQHGSMNVLEIVTASGSTYVKDFQGQFEINGTLDFNTGTKIF
jgi:hypothetical protein